MDEPGRLVSPGFTDGFVRCEAASSLQTTGEVVGGDEVGEMLTKLIVAVVARLKQECGVSAGIGTLWRFFHAQAITVKKNRPRLRARPA